MPSTRRVQLVRTPQLIYSPYQSLALRFTVDAINGNLIDNNLFKLYRRPVDPADPTVTHDDYVAVCSPGELTTLQIGSPASGTNYFRDDHLDLTFDTEVEADAAWDGIQAGAVALVAALDASDTLGTAETVWIGPAP